MDAETIAKGFHRTTTVLSEGVAAVMGNTVPALETHNSIYGQTLVWGMFNVERGKFKGTRLANNASTEGVEYVRNHLKGQQ